MKNEAVVIAKKWGITTDFKEKRLKVTKRLFDELALDHRFDSQEQYFRVNVYLKIFDQTCGELRLRFNGFYELNEVFDFLNPKKLVTISENDLLQCAKNLIRR